LDVVGWPRRSQAESAYGQQLPQDVAVWRILNAAVLTYENSESFTIDELNKQYLAGRSTAGLD
jgi:hypothetical protein